jgi:hypothetical protein
MTDASQRMEAELMFYKQAHEVNLAQIGVNKEEAGSGSLFIGGWRPFVGWVCGGSFAYAVVGNDILNCILKLVALWIQQDIPILPKPDLTLVFELLLGLLGLGAMRTYEKLNNVASK